MQPQAKADGDVETSFRRPKINAADALNYMKDFSQEFQRPGSNTITQHAVSEINPIVYDVDYTVMHNSSQGTGGEGHIRKDKMTTEQRHSQRDLSNVVRHGNSLANSFMKIETGLLGLRFDGRGSASFREKIAAGQRIALRIYIQNEIKRRAADLGLVKLGSCETSLIRDVAKRIVERGRTMTQAEGNMFADDIFQREFKPDVEDESGVGYIEPFLKRSKEIHNEISELIWNLQFDRTFARTMSHLLPLNYNSWAKEKTIPKGLIKRKRLRKIKRERGLHGYHWVEL
uniref:MAT1-2-4 n=1 Tax=Botrytis elliptica TaxID=278938 RepID=A0A0E3TJ69_9HELO|nr:MAT1-2-4 [Botrytis elliptica]